MANRIRDDKYLLGVALAAKLNKPDDSFIYGKGGYWIKGDRFYSIAEARKLTGLPVAHPRQPRQVMSAYGDYATIAMINGIKQSSPDR